MGAGVGGNGNPCRARASRFRQTAVVAPARPPGAVSSSTGSSAFPRGTASVATQGTTVTAIGAGAFTVARYGYRQTARCRNASRTTMALNPPASRPSPRPAGASTLASPLASPTAKVARNQSDIRLLAKNHRLAAKLTVTETGADEQRVVQPDDHLPGQAQKAGEAQPLMLEGSAGSGSGSQRRRAKKRCARR